MTFHTVLKNPEELKAILQTNPSWVILKFSATWCGPCKKIQPIVTPWIQQLTDSKPNVQIYLLDIDENFEIYGYLKNRKRLNGIPAILAYKKGNIDVIPDYYVAGTNKEQYDAFFQSILNQS